MSDTSYSVWIVEDDAFLRESYETIINSSSDFVATETFKNGESVLVKLSKGEKPDIMLMDIQLPGMSGVECTERVKAKHHEIIIIMVTVFEDSDLVFNSLKAGASGYITKNSNYGQILEAIKEIVDGGAPISSHIAKLVIESFHKNPNSPLTKRESQILQQLASGKTFTQISEQLFIARETTKTHIRNIYLKLEVSCRAEAIEKATRDHLIQF